MQILSMSLGQWLEHNALANAMENIGFLAISVSIVHYLGFFVGVGTNVIVDLRLLGLAGTNRNVTQFTEPLLPWAWTGLGLAILTGFLQFMPDATTILQIDWFYAKLAVIVAGVLALLFIQFNVRKWDQSISPAARLIALASLLIWIAAILSATEVPQKANL